MALAIIGSGFGRTGTMSTKLALQQLGFGPCHHMIEVVENPAQPAHWKAIAAGEKVVWAEVFDGYKSQVDWPGAAIWRETSVAFPDAKVLHTAFQWVQAPPGNRSSRKQPEQSWR